MKRLLLSGILFLAGWLFIASAQGTVSTDPTITGTIPENYYVQTTTFTAYTSAVGNGGASVSDAYFHIRDEKPQNTAGGGSSPGSWVTRDINTEVTDAGGFVHLSTTTNQFIIQPGNFRCQGSVPSYYSGPNQARLQNVTDSVTTLLGTSEIVNTGIAVQTRTFIFGLMTSTAPKLYEIQHRVTNTKATNGLGVPANFTTEIYSDLFCTKEQ